MKLILIAAALAACASDPSKPIACSPLNFGEQAGDLCEPQCNQMTPRQGTPTQCLAQLHDQFGTHEASCSQTYVVDGETGCCQASVTGSGHVWYWYVCP